jgi:hypothetical protein
MVSKNFFSYSGGRSSTYSVRSAKMSNRGLKVSAEHGEGRGAPVSGKCSTVRKPNIYLLNNLHNGLKFKVQLELQTEGMRIIAYDSRRVKFLVHCAQDDLDFLVLCAQDGINFLYTAHKMV